MDDLLVVVAVAVAAVLVRARYWPYGPCRACQGRRGRGRGSTPKAWDRCRKCRGSGERIRLISRVYPRWRAVARKLKERVAS